MTVPNWRMQVSIKRLDHLSRGACSGGASIANAAIAGVCLLPAPAACSGRMLLPPAVSGDR